MNKFVAILYLSLVFLVACGQSFPKEEHKNNQFKNVNSLEFKNQIELNPNSLVIDVRTPEEYNNGHIAKAINLNIYDTKFESNLDSLDKSKLILVYCKSGGRSSNCIEIMKEKGFGKVIELNGGILAWQNSNLPLSTQKIFYDKISENQYTINSLDKEIERSEILVVDYYAKWCKPCMNMMPMIEKLEKEYNQKNKLIKKEIDNAKDLVKQKKIETTPYFEVYRNRKLTEVKKGAIDENQIRKWFQ